MRINRLKTAIALFLVLVLTETKAQVAAGYQVGTWYQFKTAAVSYTFDDNCSNQIPVALPLFDQYNYKITFNTVINWSPNWAGLFKASNNGHEIASHTMTHPASLATLSLAQQDTELGQSQSIINANIPNAKCVTVAYPNCNIGDLTTIKKYYIAGRICSGQIMPGSPSDFYNLSSIITGNTGSVQTAANLNSKVDAAKSSKGWCVFLTHGIDNDGGYSPTQSAEIKSHLTYVNTNNAVFWVGTFGNVVKYIKERNAASLTETTITSDSLKLVVADNLDNTIYNVPISIRRALPAGWQNPKIYMNGKVSAAAVSVISGTSYIVFDAVPDQGNIYLVNTRAITAPPSVTMPVTYCVGATATALTATGTNLKWYTALTGGTALASAPVPATTTAGTTNYYVTQTLSGIESSPRTLVTVTVNSLPSAPAVTTPVNYCQNATASVLSATGTDLKWYTGSTGSATAPTPSTMSVGTANYYASQTVNGCESPKAAIAVIVNAIPSAPAVTTPLSYCQNASATVLSATGSTLKWYMVSTGGTGSVTAPTASTTSVGTVNYYVSQTVNGCEGTRASIGVTVNAIPSAPTVNTPVSYCQNVSATSLTATGTSLKWYSAAAGGTSSAIAPTPVTTSTGTTNYYVSQTVNDCESSRASITVSVNTTPPSPTVSSPVTYCQNSTAAPLSATGTGLQWYTVSTGGTSSAIAPTPVTTTAGSTSYYVSQAVNGCESARAAIAVTVNAVPSAPSVTTPLAYCQNAVASVLTASGTSLKWYVSESGGTASGSTPTPSTASVGTNIYYVSQTLNGCESPRAAVTVNITPATSASITAGGATTFCQGESVTLTANNASSYTWFNGAQQVGTGNSFTAVSSGNYTVQLTDPSGCQGQVTSPVTSITVNPLPAATITAAGPTIFNQGGSVVLSANTGAGLTYQWFNGAAPVGTGSTYNAAVEGNYTLEVTNAFSCKSISATVSVFVHPNEVPVISITSPADQAAFIAPANVSITAIAADPDGTVNKVDFYNGNILLGTDPVAPYNFAMNNLAAGTYTITAIATDNNGATGSSLSISFIVNDAVNQLPAVSITAPANGTAYVESDSISLEAAASDADGIVTQVSFYNGNTLLGSDVSVPYNFTWDNVLAGTYQITAMATDNDGGSVTSSIVIITVNPNQPSVITINSPADHSTETGTSVTINVTASDPDGSVTLVEFLDGTTVIGSSKTAPYSYTMNNPSSGTHDISVRVTDSHGGVTASSEVTFTVQTQTGLFSSGVYGQFRNAYPNPFNDAITVQAAGEIKHLWLVDMYGVQMKALNDIPAGQGLELGKELKDGTFMLMVEYSNHIVEVIKIVKVK